MFAEARHIVARLFTFLKGFPEPQLNVIEAGPYSCHDIVAKTECHGNGE